MSRLAIADLPLSGLKLVERRLIGDERGFLARLFCAEELALAGWRKPIAQINLTVTACRGTIRGLHFQRPPHAEMKLVTCLRGEVWDVAVDLRAQSPTCRRWHAERLSADNHRALLIPEGFAHGFQSITDNAELLYCHSAAYASDFELGIDALDVRLAIPWPLPIKDRSSRDCALADVDTVMAMVCL
jgi:dTDP-4-dehydrorhamnose 3,5-epimerase